MIAALRRNACLLFIATVAIAMSPVTIADAQSNGDPWYNDLAGHWARPAIRVLWEEQVTDGYVVPGILPWIPGWASFKPRREITRGEWAMFIVKAFQAAPLTESPVRVHDVPPEYREYKIKPAAGYIYRSIERRFLNVSDRLFRPGDNIVREVAVDGLVGALGLTGFANDLTDAEVALILSRFTDSRHISQHLRNSMALAVKLGIIQGYPDSRLLPCVSMTRAEAATILYRSCVVTVDASPNPFSPDGDNVDDTTTFAIRSLKNRNLNLWTIELTAYSPRQLVFTAAGRPSGPAGGPYTMVWNGRGNDQTTVPDGLYLYRASGIARNGTEYFSVSKPLLVKTRRLDALVRPVLVPAGGTLEVVAATRGHAVGVSAYDPYLGQTIDLQPAALAPESDTNTWAGSLSLPEAAPKGWREIEFTADFDVTERIRVVQYYVIQEERLTVTIDPPRCHPGGEFRVIAVTAGYPSAVRLTTPWVNTVDMSQGPDGTWSRTCTVDESCLPGTYDLDVIAEFPGGQIAARAALTVAVDRLSEGDLVFVLSD